MQETEDIVKKLHRFADHYTTTDFHDALIREAATTIATLRAALETERMRLAACGVVAMSNTPDSAARARDMHPDYWCASVQDVARAVDREMALRAEVEGLRADAERLDWLESEYERERQAILNHRPMPGSLFRMNTPITRAAIDAAKAAKA